MKHKNKPRPALLITSLCIAFTLALISLNGFSQGVAINETGTAPDPSAMLDVSSNLRGLLIPRMTTTQRSAITSPAEGLLVYDTDAGAFYFYHTGSWLSLSSVSGVWSLIGNSGTNPAVNFLGTTDNKALKFKVNNQPAGSIDPVLYSNTSFGYRTLAGITSGTSNTAIGYQALMKDSTGGGNTAIGNSTLYENTTGLCNTAIGHAALCNNTTGYYNTANGSLALYSNTEGHNNTAFGSNVLCHNKMGFNNTAIGFAALYYDSIGGGNTALGYCALYFNKTGSENTACGLGALNYNITGNNNTANGMRALNFNTSGNYNTAHGFFALYHNTVGDENTAIGSSALNSNTTGNNNTANGSMALFYDTSGYNNDAFGYYAGYQITNGSFNTCIGGFSGNAYNYSYSTFLGNSAGPDNDGYTNCMALGYSASVDASDKVMIGNTDITSIGGYAGWTTFPCDQKLKKDIRENVPGLAFINLLRPVTYHVDVAETKSGIVYSGFIAQEVEAAAKSINYDFSGIDAPKNSNGIYGLRYAEFVVPLVKAVQEQQVIIEDQQNQIKVQQQQINSLMQRMNQVEKLH